MISSGSQGDHFICIFFSQVFALHQILICHGGGRLPQSILQRWVIVYEVKEQQSTLLNCSSVSSREFLYI